MSIGMNPRVVLGIAATVWAVACSESGVATHDPRGPTNAAPSATSPVEIRPAPVIPTAETRAHDGDAETGVPPAFAYGEHFAFVERRDDQLFVVLDPAPRRDWRVGGRIEAGIGASADVEPSKLPPHLRGVEGRTLRLFDGTRMVAESNVGKPMLLAELGNSWLIGSVDGEIAEISDDERIRVSFRDGRVLLVAPLVGEVRDTQGPLWARSATLPIPIMLRPAHVGASLAAQASDQLRSTAEYKATVADAWGCKEAMETIENHGWERADGRLAWIVTSSGHDTHSCGVHPSAWTIQIIGEPMLSHPVIADPLGRLPIAVFDLDGDGAFEALLSEDEDTPLTLIGTNDHLFTELATRPGPVEIPDDFCH